MSTVVTRTFPVVEIFGPVIQGEGPLAGQVTHFIRLGLCDYRCSWCDSMFAVLPEEVKQNATQMSVGQMLEELTALNTGAPWVTLSGGNPAIHQLGELMETLQEAGFKVAVETQGSRWNDWLDGVDMLIVSPKPPSSGMVTDKHREETERFMMACEVTKPQWTRALKIVVFDEEDLAWADQFFDDHPWERMYLSVGTDPPEATETLAWTRQKVCDRYRWLAERAPYLRSEVTVLPQLHVLMYGHARGV